MKFVTGLRKFDEVRRLWGGQPLRQFQQRLSHISTHKTTENQSALYLRFLNEDGALSSRVVTLDEEGLPLLEIPKVYSFGVTDEGNLWGWVDPHVSPCVSKGLRLALALLVDDDESRGEIVWASLKRPKKQDKRTVVEAVARLGAIGLIQHQIEAYALGIKLPVDVRKVWEVIKHYERAIMVDGGADILECWMISQKWPPEKRRNRHQELSASKALDLVALLADWRKGNFDIYS